MLNVDQRTGFTVREKGYDVGEVVAHIASLEARIEELEAAAAAGNGDLLTDVKMQALRLLATAREDAEAMVAEARREADRILDDARTRAADAEPLAELDPRLEVIRAELSAAKQRAFTSVAARRGA